MFRFSTELKSLTHSAEARVTQRKNYEKLPRSLPAICKYVDNLRSRT
jgi:hypothetical protein